MINLMLYFMAIRYFSIPSDVVSIIVVIIGAVLADIDKQGSLISRTLVMPFWMIFSGHRNETHTVVFAIGFSVIIGLGGWVYGVLMFSSYILHLMGDSCTDMGVPWLYPLKRKKYSLRLFKSGDGMELFLVIGLFMVIWTMR